MSDRRGAVLLEAVVALALLSLATSGLLGLMLQMRLDLERIDARERELQAMERVLGAMALLTPAELALRQGDRRVGEFMVRVTSQGLLVEIAIRPVGRNAASLITRVRAAEPQ